MQVVWCDEDERCPRLLSLTVEVRRLDQENSRCHEQLLTARLRNAEQDKLVEAQQATIRTQSRTIERLKNENDRIRERLPHKHDQ